MCIGVTRLQCLYLQKCIFFLALLREFIKEVVISTHLGMTPQSHSTVSDRLKEEIQKFEEQNAVGAPAE